MNHPPARKREEQTATPLDRVRAASTVEGPHVRIPELLVPSRNHSAIAVAVVAVLELRSDHNSHTTRMRRSVVADMMGLSTDQWKRAIRQLLAEHNNSKGVQPQFVSVTRRGQGRAADRMVTVGIRFVSVPVHAVAHLLVDSENPITPKAFRYLSAIWKNLPRNNDLAEDAPWCEVANDVLAREAAVSPVTVPTLRRELEDAGLILTDTADGRTVAILPLARPLSDEDRADIAECLRAVLTQRDGSRRRPRSQPPRVEDPQVKAGTLTTTPKKRTIKLAPPPRTSTDEHHAGHDGVAG